MALWFKKAFGISMDMLRRTQACWDMCEQAEEEWQMTKIKDLHAEWMKDDEYRQEYEALSDEFDPAVKTVVGEGVPNPHIGKCFDGCLHNEN